MSFTSPDFSSEESRLLAACFMLLVFAAGDLERERDLERGSFFVAVETLLTFALLSESPLFVESVVAEADVDVPCFPSTEKGCRRRTKENIL